MRLTPKGGRDAIEGWTTDPEGRPLLKARVAAPPVEGQANAAVIRLLAKSLGLPKSAVTLVSGEVARIKRLRIEGVSPAELLSAFRN